MRKNDLISIIVPIYNSEKTLERCINSIINQTYKNIEIILVNDGSQDDSLKICCEKAHIDERIIVINKSNGGASSARNLGIDNANGKFIEFVDSDDYIEHNYTESLYRPFVEDETIDLTIAGFTIVGENIFEVREPNESTKLDKEQYTGDKFFNLLRQGFSFVDSPINRMYKRDKIFKFDCNVIISEDKIFNLSYLDNVNSLFLVKNSGYYYTMQQTSLSHSKYKFLYRDLQKADDKLVQYVRKNCSHNIENEINNIVLNTFTRCIRHAFSQSKKNNEIKNDIKEMLKNYNLNHAFNSQKLKLSWKFIKIMMFKLKMYYSFIIAYKIFCKLKKYDLRKI